MDPESVLNYQIPLLFRVHDENRPLLSDALIAHKKSASLRDAIRILDNESKKMHTIERNLVKSILLLVTDMSEGTISLLVDIFPKIQGILNIINIFIENLTTEDVDMCERVLDVLHSLVQNATHLDFREIEGILTFEIPENQVYSKRVTFIFCFSIVFNWLGFRYMWSYEC